jgi:hypothetical protein
MSPFNYSPQNGIEVASPVSEVIIHLRCCRFPSIDEKIAWIKAAEAFRERSCSAGK